MLSEDFFVAIDGMTGRDHLHGLSGLPGRVFLLRLGKIGLDHGAAIPVVRVMGIGQRVGKAIPQLGLDPARIVDEVFLKESQRSVNRACSVESPPTLIMLAPIG